ncbi:hypothetical protein ACN2A0_04150 [Aerococcus viridans]
MGRGTNQIFAWGPWIYLVKKNITSFDSKVYKTLNYFNNAYKDSFVNGNIIMNNYEASNKDLWWDYHHSSVYQSHLVMWMSLSMLNIDNKVELKGIKNFKITPKTKKKSGIRVINNPSFYIFLHDGSQEYFAEIGPAIYNIWTSNVGTIFKGGYGPTASSFGLKSLNIFDALINHCGPIHIGYKNNQIKISYSTKAIDIKKQNDHLIIRYEVDRSKVSMFNFAYFKELEFDWKILNDQGRVLKYTKNHSKNQYGDIAVIQTDNYLTKYWYLKIKLDEGD